MADVLLIVGYLAVGVVIFRLVRGRLHMDGDSYMAYEDYAVVGLIVVFWPPLVITLAAIPILSLVGRLVMGRPKL